MLRDILNGVSRKPLLSLIASVLISNVAFGVLVVDTSVDGRVQPWSPSINPSFTFGLDDGLGPTIVGLNSFSTTPDSPLLFMTSTGGTVSARPGTFPFFNANGSTANLTNGNPGSTGNVFPSYYMPGDWNMYLCQLVATFTNDSGLIVGTPFALGIEPRGVHIPVGATQLQLGINDDKFADNSGSFNVRVTQNEVPEPASRNIVGIALLALSQVRRRHKRPSDRVLVGKRKALA